MARSGARRSCDTEYENDSSSAYAARRSAVRAATVCSSPLRAAATSCAMALNAAASAPSSSRRAMSTRASRPAATSPAAAVRRASGLVMLRLTAHAPTAPARSNPRPATAACARKWRAGASTRSRGNSATTLQGVPRTRIPAASCGPPRGRTYWTGCPAVSARSGAGEIGPEVAAGVADEDRHLAADQGRDLADGGGRARRATALHEIAQQARPVGHGGRHVEEQGVAGEPQRPQGRRVGTERGGPERGGVVGRRSADGAAHDRGEGPVGPPQLEARDQRVAGEEGAYRVRRAGGGGRTGALQGRAQRRGRGGGAQLAQPLRGAGGDQVGELTGDSVEPLLGGGQGRAAHL